MIDTIFAGATCQDRAVVGLPHRDAGSFKGNLAARGRMGERMRAIFCAALIALLIPIAADAQAQECSPNHELYRIVSEYRAILLDGGEIKRVMFVDPNDERLKLWNPGNNITYCPNENKMINTSLNSVTTLLSEFAATSCKPRQISDAIDGWLLKAWDHTSKPYGHAELFLFEAKSNLGWYYKVCTDHAGSDWSQHDLKDFLMVAASLTKVNIATDDPANASTYKARAAQYENWRTALYEAEGKKSITQRLWERVTH